MEGQLLSARKSKPQNPKFRKIMKTYTPEYRINELVSSIRYKLA